MAEPKIGLMQTLGPDWLSERGYRWEPISGARLDPDDWLDIRSLEPGEKIRLCLKHVAERYGGPPRSAWSAWTDRARRGLPVPRVDPR